MDQINSDWDWQKYTELMQDNPAYTCPICRGHKSQPQRICEVCFTEILDSRNGKYPERITRV